MATPTATSANAVMRALETLLLRLFKSGQLPASVARQWFSQAVVGRGAAGPSAALTDLLEVIAPHCRSAVQLSLIAVP